ncbi:MAG: VWA domain-containing protein [Acidobacteriota bacterium]
MSIVLFLWPAAVGPTLGPAQKVEVQKPLQHEVTVTLKLIQVYVTDRSGKPVLDLEKSDFIVYDNGVLQRITDFEKHAIPGQVLRAPAPATETIAATPLPKAEQMSRKFFIIFDFAYNSFIGVVKARRAALDFIDSRLLPTDEVALLSYSALKSLTLHEYLTTDHQKVRQAVGAVAKGEIGGRALEIEEQYWKNRDLEYQRAREEGWEETEGRSASSRQWKLRETQESERLASKNQAFNFLSRMTDLAKALRYIPGQKNVIFFSSGIPASFLSGTGQMVGKARFDFGDYRLRTASEELLKELSSSNCLVFSFDTREKDINMFRDDSETFVTGDRGVALDARTDTIYYRDSRTGGESTLRRLSGATGGKYFGNIDRYEGHLQKLQDLTGSYYVLGYSIDERWDGEFHAIKVEVRRKGCRVHSQTGYFNPKPFREYSDLEKKLHLMDLALNEKPLSQTPQPLLMKPLVFSLSGEAQLFLLAEIPATVMEKFTGKTAEVVALSSDEQGNIAKIEGMVFEPNKYRGQNVIFSPGMMIQPGRYRCRLVLRDLDTGEAAVGQSQALIGKTPERNLILGQPLLLVPGPGIFCLEEKKPETLSRRKLTDIYSFDARASRPLLDALRRDVSRIQALVPFCQKNVSPGDVNYQAYVVGFSSKQNIPILCIELEHLPKDGFQAQFLELELGQLDAGEYVLYIMAQDSSTKDTSYAQTTFVVR